MEPEHYKYGGGSAVTVLHPLVLATMVVVMIVLLVMSRRHMIPAFLCGTFLIPAGQQVLLAGVHVFAYRFIVLAGLLRMVLSRQQSPQFASKWNSIDTVFSLAIISHAVAFTLLYSDQGAVVNQSGFIWDYLGGYVFLRYAISNKEDILKAIRLFAILAVVFAACMTREQLTGQNIFGLLGGVAPISEVREGHIRSQAVFQHAILAGTFGATLVPLFVLLWKAAQSKVMAVIGLLSALVMAATTACSTPALAFMAGILGIFLWPVRKHMRWLRWGLLLGLVLLSVIMKASVWYVIAHVGVFTGSSIYHRADLVDTFLRHIDEWWLLGTSSNGTWGYMMFDTSNQYVTWGVTGGLISLLLFIATISCSFRRIGRARKIIEGFDRQSEWFLWLLGSALFANTIAFFGISYFDQTRVAWFTLLAMISAATTTSQGPLPVEAPVEPIGQAVCDAEVVARVSEQPSFSQCHLAVLAEWESASPEQPTSFVANSLERPAFSISRELRMAG